MQPNLFFHAVALLYALASVGFVTLDAGVRGQALAALGFAAGVAVGRLSRLPDPVWAGGAVACLAILAILRPRLRTVVAAGGGALAGVWASMLSLEGLPLAIAVVVAGAAPALSAFFTRRDPRFAPLALGDEALVVVFILAVVVAIAPGVIGGWQSAGVLNLLQKDVAPQVVPVWTLVLTLGAAALGGLYTVWTRR